MLGVVLEDLDQLIGGDGFQAALVASAVAVALVVLLLPPNRWTGWALAALAGIAVGWRVEHYLDGLLGGLLLLGVAGALGEKRDPAIRAALSVPGGLVLAQNLPAEAPTWMRAVLVATVVVAPLFVLATARSSPRVAPALLLGTSVGVYVCVPETGPIPTLIGALLAPAVLALVWTRGQAIGAFALTPVVGAIAWAAVDGGATRAGSVVGAIACFGVLVVAPLVFWRSRTLLDEVVLLAVDAGVMLFLGRVAGFRESVRQATVLSAIALVGAAVVLAVFAWWSRRQDSVRAVPPR
jgi:hypothetical protein